MSFLTLCLGNDHWGRNLEQIAVQSLHLKSTFSISILFLFIMFVFFKVQTAKISVFPLPMHTHIDNYHICHKFASFATSYVKKIINYYLIENSLPRYYLIILNKMPIFKNLCRISRKLSKLQNLLVIKLYIMRLCWWLFNVEKFINLHMQCTLLGQ